MEVKTKPKAYAAKVAAQKRQALTFKKIKPDKNYDINCNLCGNKFAAEVKTQRICSCCKQSGRYREESYFSDTYSILGF